MQLNVNEVRGFGIYSFWSSFLRVWRRNFQVSIQPLETLKIVLIVFNNRIFN